LTQVVVVPSLTLVASPASLIIVHGSIGTTTITATPLGGFTGTLTFSCGAVAAAGLTGCGGSSAPAAATTAQGSYSVPVNIGGGTVTTSLTLQVTVQ